MKTVNLGLSKQLKEAGYPQEAWKTIVGFEDLYEVSSLGNVRRIKTERILKPQLRRRYYSVSLSKHNSWKSYPIHRLVALAFLPNPNNYPEVNHKDSNQLNNTIVNLEWCSKSYNKIHSYNAGTSKPTIGEKNGMAILTKSDVKLIKVLLREGRSRKELALVYHVSYNTIAQIERGERWKNT